MRVFRFGVVGMVNTFIDFGILNLLMWLFEITSGADLVLYNASGFLAASLNSYLLNKKWTFEEKSRSSMAQYLMFLFFSTTALAVNSLVFYLLTTVIPCPESFSPLLWANFSKVFATVGSMVWNYMTYHRFVFNEKGRPSRAPL